ncbi:hypothetical protein [Halorubrum aethiopicum]|uniref:hypothetical protein n=1 Tax=Halorubrum aethiopicum TaxID=1758255 RepID=UPI000A66FCD4|nr:hypothetical protein [Halorubrum aethiopicum]
MTFTNNELAALGLGLSMGAGATLVRPSAGLAIGLFGIVAILVAIKRDRAGESDNGAEVVDVGGNR